MYNVFIDGRAGTTGLRIEERLQGREDICILTTDEASRKDVKTRKELLHSADIAFLCLPDDAAKEAVALAAGSNVKIIDASTAHRTAIGWAYGFPELSLAHRQAIEEGKTIAAPGCHASGYVALVYPLVAAGFLAPDALLSCTSITGYSGGGKSMIAEYEAVDRPEALLAPRQYATAQAHKHLPEMQEYSGLAQPPVFNPVLAPYYAGMLVSVPLHTSQLKGVKGPEMLQAVYEKHYAGQKLMRVLPGGEENIFLSSNELAGKDNMELWVLGNKDRITLYARYDNLGKGASGAAIQCMNLLLGRPEAEGLNL